MRLQGVLFSMGLLAVTSLGSESARNPVIWADVPDMAMIRVGDTYYMSSTTMHMCPGLPLMTSTDLVNWRLVSYAHETLENVDELNLVNGKSAYGRGSWASSLRHHNGTFYVTTFSGTTGKTYVYTTKNIENGPWKEASFKPMLHDHSLFFDDDGRVYMLYGCGRIKILELTSDASAPKPGGLAQTIIENASVPAGSNIGLQAEGSQLFKVNGRYYLFHITWPRGGVRTVLVHRADCITGPYEGRVVLQDRGVAQGGLIDTPQGDWYAYLFQDCGAVGRIPFLVPVTWEDGWPVLGQDGKVPEDLPLPASRGLSPGLVASDEFDRGPVESALPLVWQWNHNPDNRFWSLAARPGWLRLTAGRVNDGLLTARNTLTQRTFGPACAATSALDVSRMKDGDCAGLALLQKRYGWVGVKDESGGRVIVMVSAEGESPVEAQRVPLMQDTVYLRAECDFLNCADTAHFYYSLDGKTWVAIGQPFKMTYTLPHFMGYRFGLFSYATKTEGGHVDFDYFRIGHAVAQTDNTPAFAEPAAGFDVKRADIPCGKLEMVEYVSRTVGATRKMLVYTPPGYSGEKKYPVLYLLHGIGGDETEWQRYAQPERLLDNLIADGKAVPMIIVMPNGRAQKNDRAAGDALASAPAFAVFERDLIDDVIPAIESRYGTSTGRESRALAGLSMGGGQALNFGLTHLDLFGWVGSFSPAPNTKSPSELIPDPETIRQRLKLLYLSCGSRDELFHVSRNVHDYLMEKDVPHVWHVDGNGHDPVHWKTSLYHFVQMLFR